MSTSWTKEQITNAIASSTSIRSTIVKLGLIPAGGNYATVKQFIKEHNIDTSHFLGQGHNKGKTKSTGYRGPSAEPLSSILVKNRVYRSSLLRQRLINENILSAVCSNCNLSEWLGDPIPLELDHINGDRLDQRLENLRLLCPNCHAKTSTYRGKNIKK